jgi:hypothetical protein
MVSMVRRTVNCNTFCDLLICRKKYKGLYIITDFAIFKNGFEQRGLVVQTVVTVMRITDFQRFGGIIHRKFNVSDSVR